MSIIDNFPKLKQNLANGEKIYVAICTPMYGGVGSVDYFISLMNTQKLFDSVGIQYNFFYTKQESLVQRARNTVVAYALDIKEVTHILFIDADIQWNPDDVLLLLENDVDIVGGVYPKKSYNFKKVLNVDDVLKTKKANKYNDNIPNELYLKHHLVDYNLNGYGESKIEGGIVQVKHIANGFMMIKRKVFENMILEHPEWEYIDDTHNPQLKIKFYSFFDCIIKNKHYLSEDWTFCERWEEMGGKIYANITIPLNHIGTIAYEGRILSTIPIN